MIRPRLIKYSNYICKLPFLRPKRIKLLDNHWALSEPRFTYRPYSILVKMSSDNAAKPDRKLFFKELRAVQDKKVTRSHVKDVEKDWKEYYLNLPIEEKRKTYHCGKKYVCLDRVEDWSSYAAKVKRTATPKFDVDEQLNMKISLWRGDITTLEIDVICNAANNSLLGGGGVDGAIHRAAGKRLYDECCKIGGCKTGEARLSGGYKLPAKHILHTPGPIGEHSEELKSCYLSCLNLAKKNQLRTIAFPCISTGIYGYDVEKATPVVMQTIRDWLLEGENSKNIDKIIFCVFLIKDVEVYETNLLEYFPVDRPCTELPEKKKPKTVEEKKGDTKKGKEKKKNKTKKETEKELSQTDLQSEIEEKESERNNYQNKKKPKTAEETKGNKKEKERKENSGEKKSEEELTECKTEMEQKENETDLPEKKKPKTVEETKGNTKKDKGKKDDKTEKETEKKLSQTDLKPELEKNTCQTSSL